MKKKGVPAIPMLRILIQYVKDNNIPLRLNRPEELLRAYQHFCLAIKMD